MTSESPPPPEQTKTTDKVKTQAKRAYDEGQARRVVISKGERTYYDVSLLITIVLAIFAPWVAIGALVLAVVTGCKIDFTGPASSDDSQEQDDDTGPSDEETLAT